MGYGSRLKFSFSRAWQNPALLSVVLLWFLLAFLLTILFEMVRLGVLYKINPGMFYASINNVPNALSHMTAGTYAFYAILFLVQGLVFVYVLSFFTGGLYGMLKNLLRDGSTVFSEFYPEAKRHWYAMFRLQLVRFLVIAALLAILSYGLLQYLGTTPGFLTPRQQAIIAITIPVSLLGLLLFSFFTLYAESLIVLEDSEALPAMRDASRLSLKNFWRTLGVALTAAIIVVLGMAIMLLMSRLVHAALGQTGWGFAVAIGLDFLLYVVFFAAGVIASIFIISSCYELTNAPHARKHAEHALNATKPPRKKSA